VARSRSCTPRSPVDADIAGEVLLAAGVAGFLDRRVARIATAAPKIERAGDLGLVPGAAVDPGDRVGGLLGRALDAVTGLQLVPVHLLRLAQRPVRLMPRTWALLGLKYP
jgi:hypothetical protein